MAIFSVFIYHILSSIAPSLMPNDPEAVMLGKEAAMPNTHKRAGRAEKGQVQLNQPPGKGGAKVGKLKRSYQTRPAALPGLL